MLASEVSEVCLSQEVGYFFFVAKNIFISLTGYKTKEKQIDSHLLNGSIYKLSSPTSGSKTQGAT